MQTSSSRRHLVLVHGAGGGGWSWYKVTDLLLKAGHTVSALDMAGAGIDSREPDDIRTLQDYNQPLTDFFTALPSHEKVILVGHSVGGFNLTMMMEQFPHKIVAAVFVTAFMPLTGTTLTDSLNEILSRVGSFGDTEFFYGKGEENPPTSFKFGKQFGRQFVLQNTPSWDITLVHSLLKRCPLWEGAISYTSENYGSVSRAYVVAKEDKFIVQEMQKQMITDNPPQMLYEIEGSDDCPFFSKPDSLAQILLQIANKCTPT
ncbi:hypothetical protein KI387_032101 [Taxus chinensis]|uniref:AB hydrolase-1 domain-containing protein n=1 Tax=Taxus chinensis TaxID=29808 RepID=A0AA38BYD8_TAXCH|nr:hypothetical protein KI387_032101 [Taxus chinensis]